MDMQVETAQGRVPVTILRPHGRIDGSNYQELVDKTSQLVAGGAKYLLVDMKDVGFLSSAGLVALHSIILLLRGEKPTTGQDGWDALNNIDRDASGKQNNIKLLNLQAKIANTLEMSGMDRFFEIFDDEAAALASF